MYINVLGYQINLTVSENCPLILDKNSLTSKIICLFCGGHFKIGNERVYFFFSNKSGQDHFCELLKIEKQDFDDIPF